MMLMAMMIPKREADKKDSVLALPLLALPPRLVGDVTVCPKETKNKGIAITPPFFFCLYRFAATELGFPN